MALPQAFIEHLRTSGYHPRSNKHSNSLAESMVDDLLTACRQLRDEAASGELVYDLNFDLVFAGAQWNVDLVLGTPPSGTGPPPDGRILRATPSLIRIAIEIKAVMTEHHKAVKNRKRDLEAHHEHVHNYSGNAIAGGVVLVNGSTAFRSPLRAVITTHHRPDALVEHCVRELANVSVRGGPAGYGLEAMAILVVNMDNVDLASTTYVERPPAPRVGDPMHYDSFIQRICATYRERF